MRLLKKIDRSVLWLIKDSDIGAKNLKISKIQNPNLDSELILSKYC